MPSPSHVVSLAEPLRHRHAGIAAARRLLGGIVDAIAGSNRRKAEREIASYFARNGGRMSGGIARSFSDRTRSDLPISRPGDQP